LNANGTKSIAALIDAIAERGYVVAPQFFDASFVARLRSRLLESDAAGFFSAAAIGHGMQRVARADVRGDRICWLEPKSAAEAEQSLYEKLDALRVAANRELQLGLLDFEGHYAIYPPGRGCARHIDSFQDDDARVLSIVVYLNARWQTDNGGALRLHLPTGEKVDAMPQTGTLAAFLADRFVHEVLPATRQRLSIAGWFRRRT